MSGLSQCKEESGSVEGELAWSLVRTRGKSKIPGWTRFSLGPNIDWPRPLHETAGQVVSRPSVIKSISPSGPSAREQVVGQYRAQHADMATATQVFPCYAPIHRLFRIPVPRPRSRSRPLLSCSLALSFVILSLALRSYLFFYWFNARDKGFESNGWSTGNETNGCMA